jgi:hypothetical protein
MKMENIIVALSTFVQEDIAMDYITDALDWRFERGLKLTDDEVILMLFSP